MSFDDSKLEAWQRGPIPGIPPLLQPIAHALIQSRREVHEILKEFPESLLWEKPGNLASVGFHLQHLSGVLDRLFTYAEGKRLEEIQLKRLSQESQAHFEDLTSKILVERYDHQVDLCLEQLSRTRESSLTEFRGIGRKQIPTTVIGLLFHSAEHCMRHTGQLLVTVGLLKP